MKLDWDKAQSEIQKQRTEVVNRLKDYTLNDVLLYWSPEADLRSEQELKWRPILTLLQKKLDMNFQTTDTFCTIAQNEETLGRLASYLNLLSEKDLTGVYAAALNMRSPLLALALRESWVNAAEAFALSELEELHQIKKWGTDQVAENRRRVQLQDLEKIEAYLRS